MSNLHSPSERLQGDLADVRRKRLLFQCWHRGTQEGDLILGMFAETSLTSLHGAQIDQFEALLDCTDAELLDWVLGDRAPPPQHDHDVTRQLRDFWARRDRPL